MPPRFEGQAFFLISRYRFARLKEPFFYRILQKTRVFCGFSAKLSLLFLQDTAILDKVKKRLTEGWRVSPVFLIDLTPRKA